MYDIENTDALPLLVKNKPKEQQEAFVKAFNSALLKGLTDDEALLSGTSAMAILAKRNAAINNQDFSTRKRPSHVPDIAVIKALREQEAQALIQEEIEKQRLEYVAVPSYLGKSLPKNKDRNVIAANFDSQDRFVILFDTGEQLVSKSMAIKEYVEQYVSVSMKAAVVPGAMVYKAAITDATTAPAGAEAGYVYVWNTASATLSWAGQTFNPDNKVQQGDQIIYRGSNVWDTYQSDLNPATETDSGYLKIATQALVTAGTNDTDAVTPLKLQTKLNNGLYTKQYFTTSNVTALTPLTVNHNLNLVDRDAFTINTMLSNSQVSVDVDSVDANSLTITSLVNLTNLKITVQGAVSA